MSGERDDNDYASDDEGVSISIPIPTPGGVALGEAVQRYGPLRRVTAEGLAALVQELHPNTSVRELEYRAGLPFGSVAGHVRPGQSADLPSVRGETVERIASALGCTEADVVEAWAADPRGRLTAEQVRVAPQGPTPEPPSYITVGALRERLAGVADDTLVVLAKDEEGNDHSPLADAGQALYVARTPYQGDAYSLDDPDAPRGAVDVILLVPTN